MNKEQFDREGRSFVGIKRKGLPVYMLTKAGHNTQTTIIMFKM